MSRRTKCTFGGLQTLKAQPARCGAYLARTAEMSDRLARSRLLTTLLALAGMSMAGAAGPAGPAVATSDVLDKYCVTCHNGRLKTAGLEIDSLDATHVSGNAQQWEKIVTKLRTGEMPP